MFRCCNVMGLRRDLLTIIQLGAAFALIFSAFNSQGLIEIDVLRSLAKSAPETGITENSGYYSLSIIYFVFTLSNLAVPPIIRRLGNKWSQVVGAICYLSFMVTFLHLNAGLLYLGSAILGFGAAMLWTANGAYIVEFSREDKLPRNTGILWAMLQTSFISGGCFFAFVMTSGNIVNSYRLVYVVFSIVVAVGAFVLASLPSHPPIILADNASRGSLGNLTEEHDSDTEAAEPSPLNSLEGPSAVAELTFTEEIATLFQTMRDPTMLLLMSTFFFTGLEVTFYTGVFSSCVSSTLIISKPYPSIVAFIAFSIGSGQIAGGLLFGTVGKRLKLDKTKIVIGVLIVHLVAFFLCFLVLPANSPIHHTSESGYITAT
ncbi:hypothetical protein WR25_08792 isoform B [Diploscapter pachys]|nr:hypothetical protein WR25_08792 isoform B [Diploscapter pachys]